MTPDDYKVTGEERLKYSNFGKYAASNLFQTLPSTLWYYTSANTFARILKSNSVWATQIACLNDHTEFRYSVRLLREEFKNVLDDPDKDKAFLARYLYETMENDGADASFFFVFCMSLVRDDLSQWRAYGGGEGGVSIGFNPGSFLIPEITARAYLFPVKYVPTEHNKIVQDVAKWTMVFFKDGLTQRPGANLKKWADEFLEAWREQVVYLAPALKHPSFKDEKEWRLTYALHPDDMGKIEILQRSTLISRHLPLSFGQKLPIREVIVGPCRHPSVSLVSVGTYLRAQGYLVNGVGENDISKVTVTSSSIPFQTM